ncbi:MAG: peptidoglycan recognition family protein [Planctomycetota bacterium]
MSQPGFVTSRATPGFEARGLSRRTRVVWGSLLGAMLGVGGLMWGLQGGPAPRVDGITLTPLAAASAPSSIEAVMRTRADLDERRWQSIVIHHSGSLSGSAASIADEHRSMNLNGLGYHFVIGNGRGAGDGAIHVGYRWLDQLPGAHAAGERGDHFNRHGIGVCLVGDGNRRGYTDLQLRRLSELVRTLAESLDIPEDQIVLHSDIAPARAPGRLFPEATFRERLGELR